MATGAAGRHAAVTIGPFVAQEHRISKRTSVVRFCDKSP
jgi:hypothetical protein